MKAYKIHNCFQKLYNPYAYKWTMVDRNFCNETYPDLSLLIVAITAVQHTEHRRLIRKTWGDAVLYKHVGRFPFILQNFIYDHHFNTSSTGIQFSCWQCKSHFGKAISVGLDELTPEIHRIRRWIWWLNAQVTNNRGSRKEIANWTGGRSNK